MARAERQALKDVTELCRELNTRWLETTQHIFAIQNQLLDRCAEAATRLHVVDQSGGSNRPEWKLESDECSLVSRRRVATAVTDSQPQARGGLIMAKTVKVAQTSDLSPGTGKGVKADGRNIGLFNVEGTFFAIDNTCTTGAGRWAKAS